MEGVRAATIDRFSMSAVRSGDFKQLFLISEVLPLSIVVRASNSEHGTSNTTVCTPDFAGGTSTTTVRTSDFTDGIVNAAVLTSDNIVRTSDVAGGTVNGKKPLKNK